MSDLVERRRLTGLPNLTSWWSSWAQFLARREAATTLALVRICIGLATLHTMTAIHFKGVMTPLWANKDEGGIINLSDKNWLVQQLGGPDLETSVLLLWTCSAACVFLILGLGSRVAALIALQTSIALFSLHPGSGGGHDRLITNMLWLMVFARSDTTLSLWCYLRTRRWTNPEPVLAWVRYALGFQLVVMYCATGIQKMGIEWMPWGGYEAVYYAVLHPAFARFDNSWVAEVMPLVQAGTAITWLWEVSFPVVGLWLVCRHLSMTREWRIFRWFSRFDIRSLYVVTGVGMHGIIWIMMDVGPFSAVTCSFYLCLYHPDEYARLWSRLKRGRLIREESS